MASARLIKPGPEALQDLGDRQPRLGTAALRLGEGLSRNLGDPPSSIAPVAPAGMNIRALRRLADRQRERRGSRTACSVGWGRQAGKKLIDHALERV